MNCGWFRETSCVCVILVMEHTPDGSPWVMWYVMLWTSIARFDVCLYYWPIVFASNEVSWMILMFFNGLLMVFCFVQIKLTAQEEVALELRASQVGPIILI